MSDQIDANARLQHAFDVKQLEVCEMFNELEFEAQGLCSSIQSMRLQLILLEDARDKLAETVS